MKCQFYIKGANGECLKCTRQANGSILRCEDVCISHANLIKKDNLKRVEEGIDIPNSFEVIIKLTSKYTRYCTEKIQEPKAKPNPDYPVFDENNVEEMEIVDEI